MSLKSKIARILSRHLLGYEVNVLTFSQAGEDLVVRNFFFGRLSNGLSGFYIDIGAFHPYLHSNTYYLYRAGWRGINIDARPNSMEAFRRIRPGDINLEVAISDLSGSAKYYDFGDSLAVLNSISTEYIGELGNAGNVKEVYEVNTAPLAEILEKHVPPDKVIDFLSIDIEGWESKALISNDWLRFRPQLIACEVFGFSLTEIANAEVARLLASVDYEIYARVILEEPKVNTVFFVDKKSHDGRPRL